MADVEATDIYGLSDITDEQSRQGIANKYQFNRLVLKTNQQDTSSGVHVKNSLLKKCNNLKIRCDLADCGMYVFSYQAYKLMLHLEQEHDYRWLYIAEDFIPFIARNQFKTQLNSLFDEAQKDKLQKKVPNHIKDCASKIDALLNPDKEIMKDQIKVMVHIDSMDSNFQYIRLKSIK